VHSSDWPTRWVRVAAIPFQNKSIPALIVIGGAITEL
jgi:hypothetical protein